MQLASSFLFLLGLGVCQVARAMVIASSPRKSSSSTSLRSRVLPPGHHDSSFSSSIPVDVAGAVSGGPIIATVAGTSASSGSTGDNGPATSALLGISLAVSQDTFYIYVVDYYNNRVRFVNRASGIIAPFAGTGVAGSSGDGGPATAARLNGPTGLASDTAGTIYICENQNNKVRVVTSGTINTFAGTGQAGSTAVSGDGLQATSATITQPLDVQVDASGNVYVVEALNRVRFINKRTGIISTIAGTGVAGFGGDNGPATLAQLNAPNTLAVDVSGNVYIADGNNNRVRFITRSTGIIRTFVGTGQSGVAGDNRVATSAQLSQPAGLAVDAQQNLFIADFNNYRIRLVRSTTNIISTVVGTGSLGNAGDGGPATSAALFAPNSINVDAAGNLLVADYSRLRQVACSAGTFATGFLTCTACPVNTYTATNGNVGACTACPPGTSTGGATGASSCLTYLVGYRNTLSNIPAASLNQDTFTNAFIFAVSNVLGVPTSTVTITGVTAGGRRHLLQTSTMTYNTNSQVSAATAAATLTPTALQNALRAQFPNAVVGPITINDLSPTTSPSPAPVPASTPQGPTGGAASSSSSSSSSSGGASAQTIGIAVGVAGVAVLSTLGAILGVCCCKKPLPPQVDD